MTYRISASQFIAGYINLRIAADSDDESKALDALIKDYQNLLYLSINEPRKMTSVAKRQLKTLQSLLPGYLERLRPDVTLESLKPAAATKSTGPRPSSKKPDEKAVEHGKSDDEDLNWEEQFVEDSEKYTTSEPEKVRAKSVGRAVIELLNRSFPGAPMSMTRAIPVGERVLRSVSGILYQSGTKDIEDVISDKIEGLLEKMQKEVVDEQGNKSKWSFRSPSESGKPGAKDVDEALNFLIGYLKRSAIDVKRSEKKTVDDPIAQLAYLKFKMMRTKLSKKELEKYERLMKTVPNAEVIEPSPVEPTVTKTESHESAFGRRDEGGELVEPGESAIPDVEKDPLMADIIADPVGAERLMGAITKSLPNIQAEVKALGAPYEVLWNLIFEEGKGDVLTKIKDNMNKNRDFMNELKAAAAKAFGYTFQQQSKSAIDQYAYYLHKTEQGDITDAQKADMSKIGNRLVKEGVDLSGIEPIEVAPDPLDEWKDFIKTFSNNPEIKKQGVTPPGILPNINNPEGRAIAAFAQKIVERPGTIGDARDKLLKIIKKNFTDEEVGELEDFYHSSDKDKRKLEEKIKGQETYKHWRDIDRRKIEKLLEKVSNMDVQQVAGLLVKDIESSGLQDLPENERSKIKLLAQKLANFTITKGEIEILQNAIRKFRPSIPVEYVDKLLEIPPEFVDLAELTEKGVEEDKYNRLLWLQSIRPLTAPEERKLNDLKSKFKGRKTLPTGVSPGEGYAIELSDFSKLLRLQQQQDLNMVLWDYFDELEDVLMNPPYDLTPVEIGGINPSPIVTDSQKAALYERAVKFLESKGVEVEEEPREEPTKGDLQLPGLKDYADLKYLDESGLFEAFSGEMYFDPTDKRTHKRLSKSDIEKGMVPQEVKIPVDRLNEIYTDIIPKTLKIQGKIKDADFYEDIDASKTKPSVDRLMSILNKYKSRFAFSPGDMKIPRVALRIAGLSHGWN